MVKEYRYPSDPRVEHLVSDKEPEGVAAYNKAWFTVVAALNEVDIDWALYPSSGLEAAAAAILRLNDRALKAEKEVKEMKEHLLRAGITHLVRLSAS